MTTRTKPPYRADHVGSLLRSPALKAAREKFAAGDIDAAALSTIEDEEIIGLVKKQEAVGLKAATDGEYRRSWWHLDFLWGLDGVSKHVMESGVTFAGMKTRAEGVRVDSKIGFSGHPMIDHFKFLHDHTNVTAKITIPAPSAIYGRPTAIPINKDVYPEMDGFWADVGEAYKQAVRAFADAGCRYLQLDDVFLVMLCDENYRQQMRDRGDDPDQLAKIYSELINVAISDRPDDMTITMHMCRGNYRSTYQGAGAYDRIQDELFNKINVDGYFMEYDDDRSGGFEALRLLPKDKSVVLGLVTTKRGELEDKDMLKRRIDEAATFTDLDQLCLSGQCGFASTEEGNVLTEDDQWAKLGRIVEVAADVWS